MEHGDARRIGSKMGKLYFKNMDEEWEQFPTDEMLDAARKAANDLELLGYKIICQMCNEKPTIREIKERAFYQEWKCPKCSTINSAGKA
jgi:predicted RNA-binding Zn-ribbon protein involved in translation (DUF1610 family)